MENFVCKILLSQLPGQNRVRITYINLVENRIPEDFEIPELQLQTIERLNHWIKKDESCDRQDLSLIGRYLYNILFPPNSTIRQNFEENYNYFLRNKGELSRLRIVLSFHENVDPKIVNFPWEFLFKEEGPRSFFFAGQKTELILTRFVPIQPPEVKADPLPLRILLAVSQPSEFIKMDTAEIQSYLKSLSNKHPGMIELQVIDNPTHAELKNLHDPQHPDRFLPHIFHFVGHGRPGELALIRDIDEINELSIELGEKKTANWCDSMTLTQVFKDYQPRVVFLHAKDGSAAGSVDSFNQLTRDLVYANIPAVIAMQYKISDQDASLFAMEFYRQVSGGAAVDEAVRASREVLGEKSPYSDYAWNDRRFGAPVVYLQTEEAIIQTQQPARTPLAFDRPVQPQPESLTKTPCPNPRCNGLVRPGSQMCPECFERLVKCENCQSLMLQKIGICDICLFGLDRNEQTQASAAPEVKSAGGERQMGGPHTTIGDLQRGTTPTGSGTRILNLRGRSGPSTPSG